MVLKSFGVILQKKEQTRETLSTSKCIDLCISFKKIEVETLKYKSCDHYAWSFHIFLWQSPSMIMSIKLAIFPVFLKKIIMIFLFFVDQALRKCRCDTFESTLTYLTDVLNSDAEKYAPCKTFDALTKQSKWGTIH